MPTLYPTYGSQTSIAITGDIKNTKEVLRSSHTKAGNTIAGG